MDMRKTSLKGWINRRLVILWVMMMVCGSISSVLVMDWIFSDFEQRRTQDELKRAANLLERDGQDFAASAADYGFWEDTFDFVQQPTPDYWRHFSANLMTNNQMDWVLTLNRAGQVFDGRILIQNNVQPLLVSQQIELFSDLKKININHCQYKGKIVAWINKKPALIAYAPVVDSLQHNPIQGCIIFGCWLNKGYRQKMAGLTGSNVGLAPHDWSKKTKDKMELLYVPELKIYVYSAAYQALKQEKEFAVVVILFNIFVLFFAVLYSLSAIIEQKIIGRISGFSILADQYRKTHDGNIRWPIVGHDEIDNLGHALNELVGKIEYQLRNIAHDAEHDPLTGIGNRRFLLRHLTQLCQPSMTHNDVGVGCLMLIDLDGFKLINDHLGHPIGDATLVTIARRIVSDMRSDDVVVRLGGDEFAVLLPHTDCEAALHIAHRLCLHIGMPLEHERTVSYVTASIGVVGLNSSALPIEFLRHADLAMYEAKRRGKNQALLFDEHIHQAFMRRVETEKALRYALEQGEVHAWFQPIIDCSTGHVCGLEALARWQWDGVFVSPDEFIPIAEEAGLIHVLGLHIFEAACQMVKQLKNEKISISCSVNVSIRQLDHPTLLTDILALLTKYQLDAGSIHLEVTESMLAEQEDDIQQMLCQCRALGLHIHLDDFGTGYSSLSRLQKMPLYAIKIDRSFVTPLQSGEVTLVRAIVDMSKTLGLKIIAEGVETLEQSELLCELGVDYMQGYLFARPMPALQLMAWLQTSERRPDLSV